MKIKIFITLVFALSLSGCTQNENLTQVTLMLDYTPNTNHTGIYVANELGYYEEYGIELEIIQPSDVSTEAVVASGASDLGISYGENVAMFNDSDPQLQSIYAILNTNTSGFLSRTEKNIKRPKDFEGKTYCGWGSAIESSLINSIVKADGGDAQNISMITAPANLLTENSECDFIWAYEGWDKISLDLNGIETNYISFSDFGIDWYTPIIITSLDYINTNEDTVQNFVSATQKGYEYAIENPIDSAEILLKSAPELNSELVYESQQFLSEYYKTNDKPLGYQSPQIWKQFVIWLNKNEIIETNEYEIMYTNKFIK